MNRMHSITLSFHDPVTECAFARQLVPRLRLQGRAAIVVGVIIYFLYGTLDHLFVPPEQLGMVWGIRMLALTVPLVVIGLTFSRWFERANQFPLALVGLSSALGLILMLWHLPVESSGYYYPGLMLATFYTYNLLGARFIHALGVNVFVLLLYNILFGYVRAYPEPILLSENFFMISANLIGGAAGYLVEYQRRQLFLREQQLDEERRQHLERSLHDRLTGLPNRDLLDDRIKQALALARRDAERHAGFFLDLDGFKSVNDQLGHEVGDIVLREIARRLIAATRETDTISRLGGDEFFLLVQDIGSCDAAAHLAAKLIDLIEQPVAGLPSSLALSASIGICLFPRSGLENSAEAIIRWADQAMYRAKAGGKRGYFLAD
ncbi:GGDEF domain-containing protein [Dechloromonas sp. HYN0024]|uniref:GGDEF domain-containing protein n=1 Tax=Dechloromonas sp. HYN0024 TaxID=2231055 RepID=UPI000E4403C6|nr:GGDEF domain-containing protein [Dechloromonas sp. HYN0024]AXS79511.1 GGDEF domain-containing protein [Dechloromonas sp. HYN0024]